MNIGNIWGKRDRLASGREGAVFPTPRGKIFFGAVQIMHIFFSYFIFS